MTARKRPRAKASVWVVERRTLEGKYVQWLYCVDREAADRAMEAWRGYRESKWRVREYVRRDG